jgi:membrane protease YdiL (CAAX protease family)
VLLQGWLEASERRHRRRLRLLWRILPGAGPVVLASLVFGGVHFRLGAAAEPTPAPVVVVAVWVADATAKLLALAYMIVLLRAHRGATAADFGWAPRKLASDTGLGLLAFVAVLPLIYALLNCSQRAVDHVFGADRVAADPLPLFFFALVLGALYYRTHRIAPSTVTHAALNATTMALVFLRMA